MEEAIPTVVVELTVAAVEVETLRLPPSVMSVSVDTDRWKKQC